VRAAQDVEHDLPEQLRSRLGHFLRSSHPHDDADDVTAGNSQPSN
jgi:glycerol-3-phosphate acyltransferase PlsX